MTKLISIPKEILYDLYWNKNHTPDQIAKQFGIANGRTIRKKMIKAGIKTKTVSEALMKKKKLPFTGTAQERAYLLGLRAGDFHARRMHLSIRMQTSTTHPAQARMLNDALTHYGDFRQYLYRPKERSYE